MLSSLYSTNNLKTKSEINNCNFNHNIMRSQTHSLCINCLQKKYEQNNTTIICTNNSNKLQHEPNKNQPLTVTTKFENIKNCTPLNIKISSDQKLINSNTKLSITTNYKPCTIKKKKLLIADSELIDIEAIPESSKNGRPSFMFQNNNCFQHSAAAVAWHNLKTFHNNNKQSKNMSIINNNNDESSKIYMNFFSKQNTSNAYMNEPRVLVVNQNNDTLLNTSKTSFRNSSKVFNTTSETLGTSKILGLITELKYFYLILKIVYERHALEELFHIPILDLYPSGNIDVTQYL